MDHIAILKKQWKLIDKILAGQKTIESRWYMSKSVPWDRIHQGETIYFKNSGEPVTVKAQVADVKQFVLTPDKVVEIINTYGQKIGLENNQFPEFIQSVQNKKYCLLIYIKNPMTITPFFINKQGFGNMAAWITAGSIDQLKTDC